jgi:hypothetical protein
MIAQTMVRLIETHSEQLARGLLEKILASDKLKDMRRVPRPELQQRVYEVYHNLSDWLLRKKESDIETWYRAIGARRRSQGVPLDQLVCALLLVKKHLWSFIKREALLDQPLELVQELELFQLVDQFFDRAIYYCVIGYERGPKSAEDKSRAA